MWTSVVVTILGMVGMCSGMLSDDQIAAFASFNVQITEQNDTYRIESSGLPQDPYGPFPNADNPNTASEQNHVFYVLKSPVVLDEPSCLPMGAIAMLVNGVPIYSPFTAEGYNAVEGDHAEIFDSCQGHPDPFSVYHYHQKPSCLISSLLENESSGEKFIGVALDGFSIYVMAEGSPEGLDECNGKEVDGIYRYYLTDGYPYSLGCYRGYIVYYLHESGDVMGPIDDGEGDHPTDGDREEGGEGDRDDTSPEEGGAPPGRGGGTERPPGGRGKRQAPVMGFPLGSCIFANAANYTGPEDLTLGTINNGLELDYDYFNDPEDNHDPNGADIHMSSVLMSFSMLILTLIFT